MAFEASEVASADDGRAKSSSWLYDDRVAWRKEEIQSLQEALDILVGNSI